MLLGAATLPAVAHAGLLSFGGRVVAVVPCKPGFLWVSIISARSATPGVPEFYIWTPFTLTFMAGPPRNPGQQILGTADVPATCFVGTIPLYGLRMQMVGTSAAF